MLNPRHQSPGDAVMLKPADFNALPSASLSGLCSVTPMDFFFFLPPPVNKL